MWSSSALLCLVVVAFGVASALPVTQRPAKNDIPECNCANKTLCNPVQAGPRKEIYAFSTHSSNWKYYDWEIVTTICVFGTLDPDLICHAHERGVRVTFGRDFGGDLTNATQRQEFVDSAVTDVKTAGADGINIDYESEVKAGSPQRIGLTQLVASTIAVLHEQVPGSHVTLDSPFAAGDTWGRDYDYNAFIKAGLDFIVLMDYDMGGSNTPPRMANSPLPSVISGAESFVKQGIAMSKLVMASPWYGYWHDCTTTTPGPCQSVKGGQWGYSQIAALESKAMQGVQWDNMTSSPWFDIMTTDGKRQQVWFDNIESLTLKYEAAKKLGATGVGMWHADAVDYTPGTQGKDMWEAMRVFLVEYSNLRDTLENTG